MDLAFYESRLLPVFEEALDLTGFALDEFKRRTERDGARLLVLASSQMSTRKQPTDPDYGRRYFERLSALTRARGIPLIDQYDWIVAKGLEAASLEFRHDSHWSALAHQVAADMVLAYLEANPQICSPQRSDASFPAQ